jgi:cytidine deaminase
LPTYPILGRKFRFFQVEFAGLPYTPTLSGPHYRQSISLPYTHTTQNLPYTPSTVGFPPCSICRATLYTYHQKFLRRPICRATLHTFADLPYTHLPSYPIHLVPKSFHVQFAKLPYTPHTLRFPLRFCRATLYTFADLPYTPSTARFPPCSICRATLYATSPKDTLPTLYLPYRRRTLEDFHHVRFAQLPYTPSTVGFPCLICRATLHTWY